MYRDDREALLAQANALRERLRAAAGDVDRERSLRSELEAKLAQLEAAGIDNVRREAAVSGVRNNGILIGVVSMVAIGALAIAAYRIAQVATENMDEEAQRMSGVTSLERNWYQSVRNQCNPTEVRVAVQRRPAPHSPAGQGYLATCYALAHQVEMAASVIEGIDPSKRAAAVGRMFDIIHPVADAGDDVAAGPIMELVVKYQPRNFMALFHAGIAAHETGRDALAGSYLRRFLSIYRRDDGWTQRARAALSRIENHH